MDIHEMFENLAKHVKETRGIDICQEHEKLSKITEFNYDIHNYDFVKYFESRTGIMITKMEKDYKEVLHCTLSSVRDNKPDDNHTIITKQRLQDCWEIWKSLK